MRKLSDDLIIEAYTKSKRMNLDKRFIQLLYKEIKQRNSCKDFTVAEDKKPNIIKKFGAQ